MDICHIIKFASEEGKIEELMNACIKKVQQRNSEKRNKSFLKKLIQVHKYWSYTSR